MAVDHEYRVTRRGEDIYVGDEEGLLETAREGNVLANDLIYDPRSQKWIFARTLPLLTGFALRGKRAAGRELADREQSARFTERTLARRSAQRRTLARTAVTLFLAALTITLVILIPATRPKPTAMSQFLDDPAFIPDDEDGEGAMPTRLASKGKTTRGKRSALILLPGGDGEQGSRAEGGQNQGRGGDGEKGAGPARGGGKEGKGARGRPPTSRPGSDSQPEDPGGETEEGPPEEGASRLPKSNPPAKLLQDYRDEERPGMLDQPIRSERARYAARYAAEAMRTLNQDNPPEGGARMRSLLAARNKALFAYDNLSALQAEKMDVVNAERLVEDIEVAYVTICGPAHGPRFCELKLDHPDWTDSAVRQIADKRIVMGMSEAQVQAAWGPPKTVNADPSGRKLCYGFRCKRWVSTIGGAVVEMKE